MGSYEFSRCQDPNHDDTLSCKEQSSQVYNNAIPICYRDNMLQRMSLSPVFISSFQMVLEWCICSGDEWCVCLVDEGITRMVCVFN